MEILHKKGHENKNELSMSVFLKPKPQANIALTYGNLAVYLDQRKVSKSFKQGNPEWK